MKISQITKELGISRKAILYYEQEGLVCPERDCNNYREFNNEQIAILKKVYNLRIKGVPVSIIKDYLKTKDNTILQTYITNARNVLIQKLNQLEQLELNNLDVDCLQPITAIEFIGENIDGPLGDYMTSHYKYFLEKDNVTYQGNEEVFKKLIEYIDCYDFTTINKVLAEYPEIVVPDKIHDYNYRQVSSLKYIPNVPNEVANEVKQVVTPIQMELDRIGYYTQFVPLVRKLSPSYNLYIEKCEWLEMVRLQADGK